MFTHYQNGVPLELCYCLQCRVLSLSFTEELASKTSEKVLIFLASVQQVLCVHITVLIIEICDIKIFTCRSLTTLNSIHMIFTSLHPTVMCKALQSLIQCKLQFTPLI